METPVLDSILARLRAALENDNLSEATAIIEGLRPGDQVELFSELEDDDQKALLPELDPTDSADILERLDDADAAELVEELTNAELIRIVDEMEPDEAADLLGDIQPERAEEVLAGMETPGDVRPLMEHADDSAGGLMTSQFLALRERVPAQDALEAVRTWHPDSKAPHYVYVVDAYDRLSGVISLRELIEANPVLPLSEFMNTDVITVPAGTDQEECARIMLRHDLMALPVVDPTRKLVGIVTLDDVADVLVDEATEDIQRMGGAQPLHRSYLESGVLLVMRTRISWLLLLFVTESLTGTVLRYFENEIEAAVALSFFIPLLIGTGGNAGSQTTSTIIRALAVGDIDLKDGLAALWHEMRVGMLLGIGMAIIAYGRALTWGSTSELAATVALAIFAIVVWANTLGSLLPLLATKLKIDPTVVSGPVMSTLVDATGLFIYFKIADLIMHL